LPTLGCVQAYTRVAARRGGMDWARLLGTLVLVLLPGLAGWAWARHAQRYGSGRTVVHESASLVVCDEKRPSGGALRMLIFKDSPTLRQSEVTISAGGEVELGAKTPLHSHVNRAMALGLAMLPLERVSPRPRCLALASDPGENDAGCRGPGLTCCMRIVATVAWRPRTRTSQWLSGRCSRWGRGLHPAQLAGQPVATLPRCCGGVFGRSHRRGSAVFRAQRRTPGPAAGFCRRGAIVRQAV
jgi:hypothetical protein